MAKAKSQYKNSRRNLALVYFPSIAIIFLFAITIGVFQSQTGALIKTQSTVSSSTISEIPVVAPAKQCFRENHVDNINVIEQKFKYNRLDSDFARGVSGVNIKMGFDAKGNWSTVNVISAYAKFVLLHDVPSSGFTFNNFTTSYSRGTGEIWFIQIPSSEVHPGINQIYVSDTNELNILIEYDSLPNGC